MNLNDILLGKSIDPQQVLVLRHRPTEPELNRVLPWLAAEKPDVFNAYQQTQGEKLERVMQKMVGKGYVASFIRHEAGKALFIGLYSIDRSMPLTYAEYWKIPAYIEMKSLGMMGPAKDVQSILWFDLTLADFYPEWKGRLIVRWPPPERSWWRWAHRNVIPVHAILEDSVLDASMPIWSELVLTWDELGVLPNRWRSVLSQWRGIYYIYDVSECKGYVGSAYGKWNILGRWSDYAGSGHGGNRLLRQCDPRNFRFSILQRVSPDMDPREVIQLESSWKERLHSRAPLGLNKN